MARPRKADPQKTIIGVILIALSVITAILVVQQPTSLITSASQGADNSNK